MAKKQNSAEKKAFVSVSNLVTIKTVSPPQTSEMKCGLLNARSVKNKTLSINELIVDNHLDILAITETWITDNSTNKAILIRSVLRQVTALSAFPGLVKGEVALPSSIAEILR